MLLYTVYDYMTNMNHDHFYILSKTIYVISYIAFRNFSKSIYVYLKQLPTIS